MSPLLWSTSRHVSRCRTRSYHRRSISSIASSLVLLTDKERKQEQATTTRKFDRNAAVASVPSVFVSGHHDGGGISSGGIFMCPAATTTSGRTDHHSNLVSTHARSISSISELVPEFAQHWSVWGASGVILKTLHGDGLVPYWACMSITNILVRTSLVPLVLQSAHTSARFANVAPEVQFLVTLFQNDIRKQRMEGASITEQRQLISKTLQTLRGIYKLHNIHPLAVFKAPLMQIPIFWYFSIDIRKIINGADPELAQELTESGFLWITDLTEPDPWYGLPIISGLLLYLNVELAMGKRSLSGETTSKSNIAIFLKDFFQSLAVFMPCFMSQSPAGVQIYLATSFIFTLFQSAALRNDGFRGMVGLPTAATPKAEPTYANEFIEMKKLEQQAQEAWGDDGEVLGKGVLAVGWKTSFPGTARPSTIQGSNSLSSSDTALMSVTSMPKAPHMQVTNVDTTPKVYAPPRDEFDTSSSTAEEETSATSSTPKREEMTIVERSADERMEAANRGEVLSPSIFLANNADDEKKDTKFNAKKFIQKRKKNRKGGAKKPRKK